MQSVAIIDDHPVARAGIRYLLGATTTARVTGVHGRSSTLLQALRMQWHDTVIMDYLLDPTDVSCEDLIETIRRSWPHINILVLSALSDTKTVRSCLSAGAMDVLSKSSAIDELSLRLRAVVDK